MISTIINKILKNKVLLPLIFVLYAMFLCILISKGTNFNSAPDEFMRYDVTEYVYEKMDLPTGCEETIRDSMWGFSYAFYPITSYSLSGLVMKATSNFTKNPNDLLFAARMVDVVFIGLYALIVTKISKELFKESISVPFEDTQMSIPNGYHEVLTAFFGDYMQLPPVENRVSQHDSFYINLKENVSKEDILKLMEGKINKKAKPLSLKIIIDEIKHRNKGF